MGLGWGFGFQWRVAMEVPTEKGEAVQILGKSIVGQVALIFQISATSPSVVTSL